MSSITIVIEDESLRRHVGCALDGFARVPAGEVLVVQLTADGACSGRRAVEAARRSDAGVRVVAIARDGDAAIARAAVRLRVDDLLIEPFTSSDLRTAIGAQIRERRTPEPVAASALLGPSEPMQRIREYVARIALTDSCVLVTGETGTGKELVAAQIHACGPRRAKPFVQVNAAAIPDSLFESELFGHERGSFTGAVSSYPGKLRLANGGTLLLDEIGDMSLVAQTKLLRAMESHEVVPLGGYRPVPIDVRIVAATNRDLEEMSRASTFRLDLLFRLNVIHVDLPPLRDRADDVAPLLAHFVAVFNRRFRRNIVGFTSDAVERLQRYPWPGNVRELRNLVEVVFVHASGSEITVDDLPDRFRPDAPPVGFPERRRLVDALAANHWNVSRAAGALHCSRMTIYRKMAQYGVARE